MATALSRIFLVAVILFLTGCQIRRDPPAIPGRDESASVADDLLAYAEPSVVYRRTPLPVEHNAYPYWERATRTFADLLDDGELELARNAAFCDEDSERTDDDRQIADWLSRYQPVLDLLDHAAAMAHLQLPPLPLDGEEWPQFSPWRKAAFLKLLRAKHRASHHNWDGAVRDIRDVLHLSNMLARGDAELIRFLIATAIQSSALTAARCLGTNPQTPTHTVIELLLLLQEPDDFCDVWSLVHRVEFTTFSVPTLARHSDASGHWLAIGGWCDTCNDSKWENQSEVIRTILAGHARPFDPSETIHLASESVKAHIDACSLPWDQARSSATTFIPSATEAENFLETAVLGIAASTDEVELQRFQDELAAVANPVGRSWVRLFASQSYVELLFKLRVSWRATRLTLLVESYRRREGALPPSLSEVVPIWNAVLVDPFSGEPFRYSRERALLWSIGENGRDDGGAVPEECASVIDEARPDEHDDIVWHLMN